MYQLHHEPGLVHTGNYALHVVDVESVLDVQPVCLCMKQHFLLMSMLYRNVSCCCYLWEHRKVDLHLFD